MEGIVYVKFTGRCVTLFYFIYNENRLLRQLFAFNHIYLIINWTHQSIYL